MTGRVPDKYVQHGGGHRAAYSVQHGMHVSVCRGWCVRVARLEPEEHIINLRLWHHGGLNPVRCHHDPSGNEGRGVLGGAAQPETDHNVLANGFASELGKLLRGFAGAACAGTVV